MFGVDFFVEGESSGMWSGSVFWNVQKFWGQEFFHDPQIFLRFSCLTVSVISSLDKWRFINDGFVKVSEVFYVRFYNISDLVGILHFQ